MQMDRNKKIVNQTKANNVPRDKTIQDNETVNFLKLAYHTVEKRYCPETHFTKFRRKKLDKNSFYTNKETRKEVTVEK